MCFGLVYQVHLIGVGFNGFGVCLPIPGEIIQSLTVAYYVFQLGWKPQPIHQKWPYLKGVHLFQTIILGIHVSFRGCNRGVAKHLLNNVTYVGLDVSRFAGARGSGRGPFRDTVSWCQKVGFVYSKSLLMYILNSGIFDCEPIHRICTWCISIYVRIYVYIFWLLIYIYIYSTWLCR